MRQFNKLKMFLHAESLPNQITLRDDQMVGFIRFGNDFTQNFYQVEIPLKVTTPSSTSGTNCSALSAVVWPE
jgi:cell surface protein SprA